MNSKLFERQSRYPVTAPEGDELRRRGIGAERSETRQRTILLEKSANRLDVNRALLQGMIQ